MVEMFVYRVALDPEQGTAVVLLTDEAVQRLLPIWIRAFEAQAIALELQGETPPRPYTHDLLASVVRGVGWTLERVTVTEVRDSTFYALLTLTRNGEVAEIDARPSDGIALALRLDAKIYVADEVLEQAEIRPDNLAPADDVEAFQQLMSGVQITEQQLGEEPPADSDQASPDQPEVTE
jgi:bifunctional DNase/RNase